MMNRRKVRLGLLMALSAALVFPLGATSSQASSSQNFIKNLAGKWRGGGVLTINDKGKKVRLRCTLDNKLNEQKRQLAIRGRCAAASGRRSVRGSITYAVTGNGISGVALNSTANARVVGSKASFDGKRLTLVSNVLETAVNRNVRTRNVITGSQSRFSIAISSNKGKGWKRSGTLSFKR